MKRVFIFIPIFIGIVTTASVWPLAWTPLAGVLDTVNIDENAPKPRLFGTLWRGEIKGLEPLGSVRFSLAPLKMILGKPALSFETRSRAIRAQGLGGVSELKAVTATGDLAWILPADRRFGGIVGGFDLILESVTFDLKALDSGCTEASGHFSTDVLQRNESHWYWRGPKLDGPIECSDGNLETKLLGQDRLQKIEVLVTMKPDGVYTATLSVRTQEPGAEAILTLYGFSKVGQSGAGSYRLVETGKWR